MASIYNNKFLDPSKDEIRVISISPESKSGVLQCTMKTVSLQDWDGTDPAFVVENVQIPKFPEKSAYRFRWGDFAALSYTWGDQSNPETIQVNSTNVQVTRNLASVLYTFRKASMFESKFMLWIDALCINQKNSPEVQSQVGKMREIYTLCWSVTGFLGAEEDESEKAIELLDQLAKYHGNPERSIILRDELLEKPDLFEHGSWIALNEFSTRPYWDRLWIIQEVALGSRRTLMFCGDKSMDWERMCHGFDVIHRQLNIWTESISQRQSYSPRTRQVLTVATKIVPENYLPHFTFAAGLPIFQCLGWTQFAVDGGYYSRWEDWLIANNTWRVYGKPLVEYFSGKIPDNASIDNYWKANQSWTRTNQGRRPATTAKGYFAWVLQHTAGVRENQTNHGDKLVIIPGCSTPLVLRPDGNHCKEIGEAYVHGFMHGEIAKFLDGVYRIEELTLC